MEDEQVAVFVSKLGKIIAFIAVKIIENAIDLP